VDAPPSSSLLADQLWRLKRLFRSSWIGRIALAVMLLCWLDIGTVASYEVTRLFSWLATFVYKISYSLALEILWPLAGFVVMPLMTVFAVLIYISVMKKPL
jgi:hypothetical protein